jgi:hypothetical protein
VYEDDAGLGSILRICAHVFLLGRGDRERGYSASPRCVQRTLLLSLANG